MLNESIHMRRMIRKMVYSYFTFNILNTVYGVQQLYKDACKLLETKRT
jgi:hypothetical protein